MTESAENVEAKFIRQTGGKGQYGHVVLDVIPGERGQGFTFENKIVGGAIPKDFIPAVKKGLEESLGNGVLGGFQVIDLTVILKDGSYHDVDSNEVAFKVAAAMAFRDGTALAKYSITRVQERSLTPYVLPRCSHEAPQRRPCPGQSGPVSESTPPSARAVGRPSERVVGSGARPLAASLPRGVHVR